MNTEINQKISQLLDSELHPAEEESLLRKISQQAELKNKLNRYQAVSQALKTQEFVMAKDGFLEKINEEIQQEPSFFLPQQKIHKKPVHLWQKTSIAIAASVAIIAVIITQKIDLSNTDIQQKNEMAQLIPSTEVEVQTASNSQIVKHERFKAYLRAHSDDLYIHGSVNYQPYARIATLRQE